MAKKVEKSKLNFQTNRADVALPNFTTNQSFFYNSKIHLTFGIVRLKAFVIQL